MESNETLIMKIDSVDKELIHSKDREFNSRSSLSLEACHAHEPNSPKFYLKNKRCLKTQNTITSTRSIQKGRQTAI